MSYGVVCTNYNNTHYTISLTDSLMTGLRPPERIVIVDNASTPSDVEQLNALQAQHPTLEVIFHSENLGYFSGLNSGIRRIRDLNPKLDYVLVGNNDLTFPPDFGVKLDDRLPDLTGHAVVIPDIVSADGLHQNPMVPTAPSRLREILYDLYYSNFWLARLIHVATQLAGTTSSERHAPDYATPRLVYSGLGALYILTQTFFKHFDELWAPTFLMGEEFFLLHQLKERGFETYYDPSLTICHFFNGSTRNLPRKQLWKLARASHWLRRQYVKGSGLEALHPRVPHAPIPFRK